MNHPDVKTVSTPETFVSFFKTTWKNFPEESLLHQITLFSKMNLLFTGW
jgi:hypothetical protein